MSSLLPPLSPPPPFLIKETKKEKKKLEEEKKKAEEQKKAEEEKRRIEEERKKAEEERIKNEIPNKKLSEAEKNLFNKLIEQYTQNRENVGLLFDILAYINPYLSYNEQKVMVEIIDDLRDVVGDKIEFEKAMEFTSTHSSIYENPDWWYRRRASEYSKAIKNLNVVSHNVLRFVFEVLHRVGWSEGNTGFVDLDISSTIKEAEEESREELKGEPKEEIKEE